MLDFLWHLRGSVPLDGVRAGDDPLYGVALLLAEEQKDIRRRGTSEIEFDRPLSNIPLRGRPRPAMEVFGKGRFWLDQGVDGSAVRYELYDVRWGGWDGLAAAAFLAAFFVVVLLIAFGRIRGGPWLASPVTVLTFIAIQLLLARIRVPRIIRAAVRGN
jgi:hypothetical protein